MFGVESGKVENKYYICKLINCKMSVVRKIFTVIGKVVLSMIYIVLIIIIASSISPIYDYPAPRPFTGKDIYNPYQNIDSTVQWKRANFHTHTRVEGMMNECDFWPEEVMRKLESFGYDIVTFSNHNEITTHPTNPALQVNLYEHGYNLLKYHKLVFGSESVMRFDHLLPILTSQKQFQLDLLARDADIIQLNHPLRTISMDSEDMRLLEGYMLMELDSGRSTENEYWDEALSAGHYSFGLANDDLHYPDRTHCIAVRCNLLATPSARYDDLLATLREGCFYAMRVPDYGNGNWEIKHIKNRELPHIEDIGLDNDRIYIQLSEVADSIKVTGQHHTTLALGTSCDTLSYRMTAEDSYARITAYLPEGEVIYTNPFARYDSSISDTPFREAEHTINILWSAMYNLALLMFIALIGLLFRKTILKR